MLVTMITFLLLLLGRTCHATELPAPFWSMSSSRKIQQCWHFKEIAWKENAKETYEVHTAISRGRIKTFKTTSNHVKIMVEKMNIHEHQLFLGCVQQGTRVLTTQIIQILDWYPHFLNIFLRIETHESSNYDGKIRRHPDHPPVSKHDNMGSFGVRWIFLGISQRHVYWFYWRVFINLSHHIISPFLMVESSVKIYFLEGIAVYSIPLKYPRNISTLSTSNDFNHNH